MGDPDPEIARENSPNSLRALYGISRQQNGLMGSTDAQIADMQISSLFASSPPFSTTELPENGHYDSVRSVSSSVLSALRRRNPSDDGYAPSNPSTVGGSKNSTGKVPFRARSLPKTHEAPDIVPRSTRAAALRAGVMPELSSTAPRAPLSKARLKETFANVPGHKRTETIAVASTAPPVVAPRMTRAASLRLGQPTQPGQPKRRPTSAIIGPARSADPSTFVGVPGHKRRESIAVASVKAPTVAPRTNKSAALRASKDAAPPTSFMCTFSILSPRHKLTSHSTVRTATTPKLPGLARSNSQASFNEQDKYNSGSRPRSRAEIDRPPRPASATASRPSVYSVISPRPTALTPTPTTSIESPTKSIPSVAAIQAPTIAPRTNRSALLRAAKMEKEAAAAKPSKAKATSRALVH